MQTKTVKTGPEHERIRKSVIEFIKNEAGDMPVQEVLAVLCFAVGQYLALQDPRKMTSDMALQLVRINIERGNREALADFERQRPEWEKGQK